MDHCSHNRTRRMAFGIEVVPDKAGTPAILPGQAWREVQTIRRKTIVNVQKLPPRVAEGFGAVPKGGIAVGGLSDLFRSARAPEHGN